MSESLPTMEVGKQYGNESRQRAILVLGMHRSGTSAVTRCLNLLGASLGSDLLPSAEDNPAGFWEHAEVVAIHEALLNSMGRSWCDARALPVDWMTSPGAREARKQLTNFIRREFANDRLWVVKDPRLCRFVPLWLGILAELHIEASALLVVRNPEEVASSLKTRDGLPPELTRLCWLEHFAEAESATRDIPRGLISYEDVLANWRRMFTKVGRELRVEWPVSIEDASAAIDGFLDSGERHHVSTGEFAFVPGVLERLYALCRANASGTQDWQPISRLVDDYLSMAPPFLSRAEQLIDEIRAPNKNRMSAAAQATGILLKQVHKLRSIVRSELFDDNAMLFYQSADAGFVQERSLACSYTWADDEASFCFVIPPGALTARVRFDPSNHAGLFSIRRMRVNGVLVSGLHDRVRSANQQLIERFSGDGIWFVSFDDDPWIEFDVRDLATSDSEPLAIEFDCLRFEAESGLGPLVASKVGNLREDISADLSQQLLSIREEFRQHLAELRTTTARLQAELDAANGHESELRQEIEALQTKGAGLEADLAKGAERQRRLLRQTLWMGGQPLEWQRKLEAAQALNTELKAHDARLEAVRASLARELSEIKTSTLWRALMLLRSLLMRVPKKVRLAFRRGLKAGWWTVTPWRMSARIRFLKQRRAAVKAAAGSSVDKPCADSMQVAIGDQGSTQTVAQEAAGSADGLVAGNVERIQPSARPGGYAYMPPMDEPAEIQKTLLGLSDTPLFSIVVPIYNTDPALLRRTIASVESQWYPHWELILVDDHSSSPQTHAVLDGIADPRMVVVKLPENRRISGATNEGIARASGDFVVFLDHDDELTADCLYELALCIERDGPDFVYSDEDKIDTNGRFSEPFFKPDWSPDTMMSTMFTCHVSCVRRPVAKEVGGLRSEYDGSQDWDFVLRITEHTSKISHIPKVLYHWRITPASCASELEAKPYAIEAGKRAREDALRRRGLSGELVSVSEIPGFYRTHYHLQGRPLFSIIIPSKNNGAVLRTCIDSIFDRTAYRHFEVLVINNGSTDAATLDYLATIHEREHVRVIDHDVPFNYSEINNFGVQHAGGEILVFLNDDTEILSADWLDYMGGYAQLPHVGAVGAKLLYPESRTVQHAGVINLFGGPTHAFWNAKAHSPGYFYRNLLEHDWIAVTGACLMLERHKFDAVGGFDEDLAVAYNDVALCFSLVEHGLFQVVCPGVHLIHHESLSRGDDRLHPEKLARLESEKALLYRKHPKFHRRDPFHNPNFAPNDLDYRIADRHLAATAFLPFHGELPSCAGNAHCLLDQINNHTAGNSASVESGSIATFRGWAGDGRGRAAGKFALVLKGTEHSWYAPATTGEARPDIVRALHSDDMTTSGFNFAASLAGVAPGGYALYLFKADDPEATCDLHHLLTVR